MSYLQKVARHQETRLDARLPAAWLRAVLQRYIDQRISMVIPYKGSSVTLSGIYVTVYKPAGRAALDFNVVVRDPVLGGTRLFDGVHTRKARRRDKNRVLAINTRKIRETPDTPFWEAFYSQIVPVRLRGEGK